MNLSSPRSPARIALFGIIVGSLGGAGLGVALFSEFWEIGLFSFFLFIFHSWEFFYVALFHPTELSSNCK
jgi:hypothetical protein